ncbi:hypothetical protein [Flavobacterium sp.]|uniref:hypothetical protein n=1 Tax=Flavobacterium sp. TaxID=239 RepID=UPI003F695370
MISTQDLKEIVIKPALKIVRMGDNTESAINLLLGTCAVESDMGTYLRQKGDGPALGIYQMEKNTHDDIWGNWIEFRWQIFGRLKFYGFIKEYERLGTDLMYSTIMARIHYYRIKESLPKKDDIEGMARYWKKYYNTKQGKGSVEDFLYKYNKYVKEAT